MIPYGKQSISEEDIEAVVKVLRSDWLTCGPKVDEFESAFAAFVGAKYAVAVNSATSALHLAMRVAGIGPGGRVVTSPNTFLASASCAAYVGAIPDFCDIDSATYNLDPAVLEATWQADTTAVVAVDYAGQACNMPEIARIARERGAIVIEDACHGAGGGFTHGGREWKLGGHPWADLTVFSFHPVKTMTTGEGGMLVTDREDWAVEARRLRSHGIERANFTGLGGEDAGMTEQGPWYYEMQELGYNYRITDFQCALGLSQLSCLSGFIARRLEIVARYNETLEDLGWLTCPRLRNSADRHLISWHLYTVLIDFQQLGKSRSIVMKELRSEGIGTQVLYIPVHLQPWYRRVYGYRQGKCPVAEEFYNSALSLPLYPALADHEVERVLDRVRKIENR